MRSQPTSHAADAATEPVADSYRTAQRTRNGPVGLPGYPHPGLPNSVNAKLIGAVPIQRQGDDAPEAPAKEPEPEPAAVAPPAPAVVPDAAVAPVAADEAQAEAGPMEEPQPESEMDAPPAQTDLLTAADLYTKENDAPADLANPAPGGVIRNDQIPAVAAAREATDVTAAQLMGRARVRYWVADPKAQPISELGGLHLRPVIMLSDALAARAGVKTNVNVLRGDARGPKKGYPRDSSRWKSSEPGILDTGFKAWLTDSDLYLHQRGYTNEAVRYEERTSAWVSTTTSETVAQNFAKDEGWLYYIEVPLAINIEIALGRWRTHHQEEELSVPYGIEPGQIFGFRDMNKKETKKNAKGKKKAVKLVSAAFLTKKTAKVEAKAAGMSAEEATKYREEQLGHLQTPQQSQERFVASTGGGGGGFHGKDWQLIAMGRDWQTLAGLYQEANVRQKITMLHKERVLAQLKKEVGYIDPIQAVELVDQALPEIVELNANADVADAPDAAAPGPASVPARECATVADIVDLAAFVVAPGDALVRHLEVLRSELKFAGKGDDAKYVEAMRKSLAAKRTLTLTGADHERLEAILGSLRGQKLTTLKAVIGAAADKVAASDALGADLGRIVEQLTRNGFASDARYIAGLRDRLATAGSLTLSAQDHDRLTYIHSGLAIHK